MKPTYDKVPKAGCMPLTSSLDHVGPLAQDARDCAILLDVLTSSSEHATALEERQGNLRGLRIGVDGLHRVGGDYEDEALGSRFGDALELLEAAGAELVNIELPYFVEMTVASTLTLVVEGFALQKATLQARWNDYFAGTRAVIGTGFLYSTDDYLQAQRVRQKVRGHLASLFGEFDLVVTPTVGVGASRLDSLDELVRSGGGGHPGPYYTGYWNAAGNPAISVPMGFTMSGLPLGLQLIGALGDDRLVLAAADAFQRRTQWHTLMPVS